MQLKSQKQFYFKLLRLLNKVKELLYITNNSIKHQSLIYTQLNVKIVLSNNSV